MQFSINTVLAIATGMANLASAAPAEAAEGYRCCAFDTCTVCADYGGPVYSCGFCDQVGLPIHRL